MMIRKFCHSFRLIYKNTSGIIYYIWENLTSSSCRRATLLLFFFCDSFFYNIIGLFMYNACILIYIISASVYSKIFLQMFYFHNLKFLNKTSFLKRIIIFAIFLSFFFLNRYLFTRCVCFPRVRLG